MLIPAWNTELGHVSLTIAQFIRAIAGLYFLITLGSMAYWNIEYVVETVGTCESVGCIQNWFLFILHLDQVPDVTQWEWPSKEVPNG